MISVCQTDLCRYFYFYKLFIGGAKIVQDDDLLFLRIFRSDKD